MKAKIYKKRIQNFWERCAVFDFSHQDKLLFLYLINKKSKISELEELIVTNSELHFYINNWVEEDFNKHFFKLKELDLIKDYQVFDTADNNKIFIITID